MNYMSNMLKNMDTATIKSIMSMQGMSISDEQIDMMKNNMSPEMMRMMKGQTGRGFGNMGMPNSKIGIPASNNTNLSNNLTGSGPTQPEQNQMPPFKGAFPDLKNMDMSSMMKIINDNPQLMNMMGPQMSKMFGEGANNDMMMKSMQNILWLVSLPSKIKAFFTSTRGMMFLILVMGLIIAYYKN